MLRGGTEETPTMHFLSGPIQALHGRIQTRFRGFARERRLALESQGRTGPLALQSALFNKESNILFYISSQIQT